MIHKSNKKKTLRMPFEYLMEMIIYFFCVRRIWWRKKNYNFSFFFFFFFLHILSLYAYNLNLKGPTILPIKNNYFLCLHKNILILKTTKSLPSKKEVKKEENKKEEKEKRKYKQLIFFLRGWIEHTEYNNKKK